MLSFIKKIVGKKRIEAHVGVLKLQNGDIHFCQVEAIRHKDGSLTIKPPTWAPSGSALIKAPASFDKKRGIWYHEI